MKKVFSGRLYDTDKMTVIVDRPYYNNGNYAGSDWIGVTKNGHFAYVTDTNGQDLYRRASIEPIKIEEIMPTIDGWSLSAPEIEALTKLGLLTEA